MKATRAAWAITLCLVLAVGLWACGGGSTPGTTHNNATLSGTYSGAVIANGISSYVFSGFANIIADGNGRVVATETISDIVFGANLSINFSAAYLVNNDLTVSLSNDPSSYSTNQAGDMFIGANVLDASAGQALVALAKRGTASYSNASLYGTYNFVRLETWNVATHYSFAGTINFNGAGACTMSGAYAELGVSASTPYSDTCTYAVSSDGIVTLTIASNPYSSMKGVINEKGEFIPMARYDDVVVREVMYLLKSGVSGYSNASLNGKYYFGYFAFGTGNTQCGKGTVTFNGSGQYSASGTSNDSIGGVQPFTDTNTYTVNANGAFTLNTGTAWDGAISPDGKTYILAQTADTTEVSVMIGMMK